MNINDFNSRMVHDGKRNNREVEVVCEWCEEPIWQRWQRVKKKLQEGRNFFCSKDCHDNYQRFEAEQNSGYENAKLYFDSSRKTWYAHWYEDGKQKSTTGAKWLWEMMYGDVPEGYVVTFKDRNSENCVPENLEIVTRGERTSEALMGHEVSDETKQKLSEAHSGKTLSEEHRFNISNSLRKRWNSGEFENIHMGENSSLWRGGTDKTYPSEFNEELRYFIRERDKFKCRVCGIPIEDRNHPVHHIDADKYNNDEDNLITVCLVCHGHIHGKYKVDDPVILAFRSMLKY